MSLKYLELDGEVYAIVNPVGLLNKSKLIKGMLEKDYMLVVKIRTGSLYFLKRK